MPIGETKTKSSPSQSSSSWPWSGGAQPEVEESGGTKICTNLHAMRLPGRESEFKFCGYVICLSPPPLTTTCRVANSEFKNREEVIRQSLGVSITRKEIFYHPLTQSQRKYYGYHPLGIQIQIIATCVGGCVGVFIYLQKKSH